MVGLDGAGKTSLLFALQHPQPLERHHPDATSLPGHFSPAVCDDRYSHGACLSQPLALIYHAAVFVGVKELGVCRRE